MLNKNFAIILFILFVTTSTNAAPTKNYISNGFYVREKIYNFKKNIDGNLCEGKIIYPKLKNSDGFLSMNVNEKVKDFVNIYSICSTRRNNKFYNELNIPESKELDKFSIIWKTYKNNKLWRLDSLNLNRYSGKIIKIDEIVKLNNNKLMVQLIKLSAGRLKKGESWNEFKTKIEIRDIQFYVKNDEYYLVFNNVSKKNDFFEVKIPQYLLKG